MALIQPIAWELPYAAGATLKGKKKNLQERQVQGEEGAGLYRQEVGQGEDRVGDRHACI